jgi:hypothetical protein
MFPKIDETMIGFLMEDRDCQMEYRDDTDEWYIFGIRESAPCVSYSRRSLPHAMFSRAILIVLVALSYLVSAFPVLPRQSGIRIPLRRRATLTNQDGTLDLYQAVASTVFTLNKHRQNLINLKNNVGAQAFNPVRNPCFFPCRVLTFGIGCKNSSPR